MISSIGFDEPKTTTMTSFETLIKKKSNDVAPYTKELVKKDKENGIQQLQLIKFDGNAFVDISKIETIEKQLDFIKNNINLFVDYNGFVLEKHVDFKKFSKCTYTNFAFLVNGLVIIDKLLESILHSRVTNFLNSVISLYGITSGVLEGSGSPSIVLNENSCQQPDGSLCRLRQPPLIPNDNLLLVHEVNFKSKSIGQSLQKCIRYFAKPSINIVILIQIHDRDVSAGGIYKAIAIVFQRNVSTIDPTSIISFGSQQLTIGDINQYNRLSHNNTPITGTLHNTLNLNNIQNNPIYMITITPPSLFLNTPLPVGMAPFVIDLFNVKQVIDRIPIFSATY
ncbi:hypothetical protein ACTFIZ_010727 [Dictyostelium cf. discoideum]